MTPTYWTGALENCQWSGEPFDGIMYDAHLPRIGWGNWNHRTFTIMGGRLGLGQGQRYEQQPDGRWLMVA